MVSTAMPLPLLGMHGIAKRFGAVAALEGASLDVGPGEVHALVGQNGAGKSTLIKVLTGFHRRDRGEVVFDGRPFEASSPGDAQAKGIATIYQEVNLVGFRSVAENIGLGRRFTRLGLLYTGAMRPEARRLLGRFDRAGLGEQMRSWIGGAEKRPVTAEDIERVISRPELDTLGVKHGFPPGAVSTVLAHLLPHAVDAASSRAGDPAGAGRSA